MRKTARFSILREKTLDDLFTSSNLSTIWRSIVRSQMRSMDIVDLHDYYDFNANIEEKSTDIRNQVLNAQYKASSPLIFRVEKRYGICRHIMIPAPSDALVLQTITEHMSPLLKKAQPTEMAYYSRDKHIFKLPHQFEETRAYPWFILWPRFQKDIWKFTDDCAYLVVTDITNFFDNIGLRELRNVVSSHVKVEEVLLDLLFNIIEQLSWSPDYLPTSLKGLPTINTEAFRLLPHVMLFEVDKVVDSYSNSSFVRWMDDINIGVNSPNEAFSILGHVNDVLKSRGLALNLSKTTIFTAAEAKSHFMFDENTYLDEVSKADSSSSDFGGIKVEFLKHFRLHLKRSHLKNWDKVTKRYFTVAGRHKITELRRYSYQLYLDNPSIRKNILLYLKSLGFSKKTANIITLLYDVERYDDVSLFNLCKLITDMEIPRTKTGLEFLKAIDKVLSPVESDFDLYCYIWFLAKYGEPHRLINLIERTKTRWRNEQFLTRQVVSVLPRLFKFKEDVVRGLLNEQMIGGPRDAASVATNIYSLLRTERLVQKLYAYLFPPKPQRPYPLSKYLILTSVLSSPLLKPAEQKKAAAKVKVHISDQWYIYWLKCSSLID